MRPSTRMGMGVLVLGGIMIGVMGWTSFHYLLDKTTTTEFCVSCHTMRDNLYEEYKTTIHYKNPSGVRAGCPDCHVPESGWGFYKAKIRAAKDLWAELSGTIDTPEKFERERLRLAKSVYAFMKETDSHECRSCHGFEAMDFEHQDPQAAKKMKLASTDGGTCIDCHKGIAHKLPDMTVVYKTLYSDLVAGSADVSPSPGDTLYTLTTISFTTENISADTVVAGRLIAATPVQVLARDGDHLNVRISGWRQEGADRILYALQGKRIFVAVLAPDTLKNVKIGDSFTDTDTDQIWYTATLDVWIPAKDLTDDLNKLWEYGEELYAATCDNCHSATPLDHYTANQWIGTLNSMKQEISIDQEQYRFMQKYLQMHAMDVDADK